MTAAISAADMDAAIIGYLPLLDKEQKAALLGIIEAFMPAPEAGDHWDDPSFVAEMERRYEDYKTGNKTVSFNDVESAMDYLKGDKE
jgi:hypothetical protein